MTDPNQAIDPQALTQQIASSYVDDYMPPVTTPKAADPAPVSTPTPPMDMKPPAAPVMPHPPEPTTAMPPAVKEPAPLAQPEEAKPPMVKEESKTPMNGEMSATPKANFKDQPDLIIPPEPEQPSWKSEDKPAGQTSGSGMPPQTLKTMQPEEMASTPDAAPTPEPKPVPKADAPKSDMPAPAASPAPATPASTPAPKKETKEAENNEQSLENQNIFLMLGIDSAADTEKEKFLDELQQIIWEDFLNSDVELLLTEEEQAEFKKIQEKEGASEEDKQTEMVDYLEKLVPDLEKIMLEKALQLKEEMFLERIAQMKEVNSENADVVSDIEKAEKLQQDQKWLDATNALNAIAH